MLGGLLGDAVGRRKIYALSSVVLGLSAVPFFYVLQMGSQVRAGQRERVKGHTPRGSLIGPRQWWHKLRSLTR